MLKKIIYSFIVILLFTQINYGASKKIVGVLEFEDYSGWNTTGEGIADMLVTELVKTNKFVMVERKKLAQVMKEQGLQLSGAVSPETAVKVGKLLGLNYMLTGGVTEFGIKKSKLGAGNLGRIAPFGGDIETKTDTARVAIDVRLVEIPTGQIVIAEKAEGEESSTGVSIDLSIAPSLDFGKDGFDQTIIGKACRSAVGKVVKTILGKVEWTAKIIKIDGNKFYLNSGEEDGEKTGKVLAIWRQGEELKDPDTGLSLGSTDKKIGTAKIIQLDKKYSIAEVTVLDKDIILTKEDYLKEEKK